MDARMMDAMAGEMMSMAEMPAVDAAVTEARTRA